MASPLEGFPKAMAPRCCVVLLLLALCSLHQAFGFESKAGLGSLLETEAQSGNSLLNRLRMGARSQSKVQSVAEAQAEARAKALQLELNQVHEVVGASEEVKADLGACKTCVFVLERIKKGTNPLLGQVCHDLYPKYEKDYGLCHQTLEALSENGNNVRYWLFEGCYKYEVYQAKEWVKPCPSHVMCSVLQDLEGKAFCKPTKMEDPFAR